MSRVARLFCKEKDRVQLPMIPLNTGLSNGEVRYRRKCSTQAVFDLIAKSEKQGVVYMQGSNLVWTVVGVLAIIALVIFIF